MELLCFFIMEDNMGWDYQCHSEKKLRTTMVAIAQPAMAKFFFKPADKCKLPIIVRFAIFPEDIKVPNQGLRPPRLGFLADSSSAP